jgi:hypothetical protein
VVCQTLHAMGIIVTALALTVTVVFAVPLAVLAAGIRRQERAGSLAARPPGFSAGLTSRVLGLHTARTPAPSPRRRAGRATAQVRGAKDERPS